MITAKILADSIEPRRERRLTTFECQFPRVILAELNTHRMLSRNSASSRAIPTKTLLKRVEQDPYIPEWTRNQRGMQGPSIQDVDTSNALTEAYLKGRDAAVATARTLAELGAHKQDVNRVIEPFMWHTALITATDWDNFFHLRNHPDAHPAFRTLTAKMLTLYETHKPRVVAYTEWHLPLWDFERDEDDLNRWLKTLVPVYADASRWRWRCKAAIGRCARVSYLTHDGKRDLGADIALCEKLLKAGHLSPFEHVATPSYPSASFGNFRGWKQYRKFIRNEHDILGGDCP